MLKKETWYKTIAFIRMIYLQKEWYLRFTDLHKLPGCISFLTSGQIPVKITDAEISSAYIAIYIWLANMLANYRDYLNKGMF